jgi:hypothetical protein
VVVFAVAVAAATIRVPPGGEEGNGFMASRSLAAHGLGFLLRSLEAKDRGGRSVKCQRPTCDLLDRCGL